jgi:1,4-dihydroxy-2-naphthoyl-CoA hydrolase
MSRDRTNAQITPALAAEMLPNTFPGDLGIEVCEVTDTSVRGRLVCDRRHLHPGGYVHGGVWVALADTIAAWGTMRHLDQGHDFTTSELKINVFSFAQTGDELNAHAQALHIGRRTQVWEVRIHCQDRLCASFVCTQMVIPST